MAFRNFLGFLFVLFYLALGSLLYCAGLPTWFIVFADPFCTYSRLTPAGRQQTLFQSFSIVAIALFENSTGYFVAQILDLTFRSQTRTIPSRIFRDSSQAIT